MEMKMDKHEIKPNEIQANQFKCPKCGSAETKVLSTKKKTEGTFIWGMIFCVFFVMCGVFLPASDIPAILFNGAVWKVIFVLIGLVGMLWLRNQIGIFQVTHHNLKCNKCNHEWRKKV